VRVLVTGGAGFIGSEFVRLLLSGESGFEDLKKLVVVDSLTYSGNLNNLSSVSQDKRLQIEVKSINDPEFLKGIFPGQDFIFNFAAESHVDRSIVDASSFIDTNIVGSFNVFKESLDSDVHRVIHISTDEVYGSLLKGSASEDSNLVPNSPYAASKAASDLIARSFHQTHKLPIIITRCSNNYGPYQNPEKLIPLAITNLLLGRKVPIYGSGENVREWIHVKDHCRAIAHVALNGKTGETYNIGGRNSFQNITLVNKLLKIMGLDSSNLEYVKDRKGHDMRYALNDSKLLNLGFRETIEFDRGIAQTVKWYETNQDWWKDLK
jgi:dTDP-glucose 4,6-dehydratase